MGIDEDLNKVLEGLRGAGIEIGNAVNSADVLAGIASLATKRADRMSNPNAAPESLEGVIQSTANIQTIVAHARKARVALSQGDSQIAAMFDGSLERAQRQLAIVQSNLQTSLSNTYMADTKQWIVDRLRAISTSALGAANTLAAALQQVGSGVGAKEKAVDDVIHGRY